MQRACEDVYVSEPVGLYMVDIVAATRDSQSIQVGASPRGSLALLKLSRCRAALDGRDYVTPDDVKSVAVPALAHRLTLRPELWVQRISAEDVVRERLGHRADAGRRRPREELTRYSAPKLAGYAGLSAVGLLAALASGAARARRADRPVPARGRRGARARDASRGSARASSSSTSARSKGAEVAARIVVESAIAGRPPRPLRAACPRASSSRTAATRSPLRLAAGETRELELTLRADALGRAHARPAATRAPAIPLGFLVWESTVPTRPQLRAYPREDVLRRILQPRETQVFSGNEVSRRKGEGIEFADIRLWRPGDPLNRINWRASARRERALGQREPSRAKHRRDHLRRLVRRGAARRQGNARPRGACDVGDRRRVRSAARSRRPDLVRRHPSLARSGHRARAAVSHRRCAARHADHPLLLLAGDRRDPAAHAAAERARDRVDAAARPALGRRAARPSRARLRPRGDRRLAGAVRRAAAGRARRGRARHLGAAARRAPPSPAARGRRRRRVA